MGMRAKLWRRVMGAGLVTAATVGPVPQALPVAQATTGPFTFHYRGESALAFFSLADSRNTSVSVIATQGATQFPRGGPEGLERVNVEVSEDYCDRARGQRVSSWRAGTAPASVEIDGRFRTATWDPLDVTMTGVEFRWTGCDDDTDWDSMTAGTAEPVTVSVAGSLTSTSEIVRDHRADPYFEDPARYITVQWSHGRYAAADVTMTTDDPHLSSLLPLPEPVFAAISHTTRIEVDVGTCGTGEGEWPRCRVPTP